MSMQWTDPFEKDRRRMVEEQIRARGILDGRVLAVMERVPRERFVPPAGQIFAYADQALALPAGQSISQPFVVAAMTEALAIQPQHRILEIGTGSGYQTAILAELAAEVYTIERIEPLQRTAREVLAMLGILNVSYRTGDGTLGWPEAAPFDGIIVTAAAPDAPRTLLNQLVDGGRLVIPVGGETEQTLMVIERTGAGLHQTPQFPCRFVKLIGEEGWAD
ncbi:MAG TPA: protein-L-isoaspartate(D-aspartate) O-methyltransferase [Phycisphaerae bacterium]|jgi:protein-L-isoaspartate(D-aspartate) O-methyltransferase|nr:protein-L-isoaspartate(D-aspartate) O-methyltransferase [Phycisphaerae bacterium]HOB73338.1 protein-L-isoaspartate(D-aspartate) O-methyltransferase [Phycisphaerae bacterium]HOJ55432.1 protein-L-isoaspartate(D-aspartate) O-methyltransferase [Phycisphaerae bacterium]HOL24980.1 protein-L-isoaspartate(D-aspartate) O-methyltransferase [Phycisphaerae bacterium]HPP20082.1 protein-L-isoaspartate(D-aspartate) O-methyltransferase [Phycisphaerae bacterium]